MTGWLQTGDGKWHYVLSADQYSAKARCAKTIGWSGTETLLPEPPAGAHICSACA